MPEKPLVLLVEDEPDIGLLLERTLAGVPVEVSLAEGGEDALKALDDKPVKLVVLDLMLPDITGWEVLEKMRAKDQWRETPVIVLSVRGEPEDIRRGKELKISRYLTKPFVPRHLQQLVMELLNIKPETKEDSE